MRAQYSALCTPPQEEETEEAGEAEEPEPGEEPEVEEESPALGTATSRVGKRSSWSEIKRFLQKSCECCCFVMISSDSLHSPRGAEAAKGGRESTCCSVRREEEEEEKEEAEKEEKEEESGNTIELEDVDTDEKEGKEEEKFEEGRKSPVVPPSSLFGCSGGVSCC